MIRFFAVSIICPDPCGRVFISTTLLIAAPRLPKSFCSFTQLGHVVLQGRLANPGCFRGFFHHLRGRDGNVEQIRVIHRDEKVGEPHELI
jgi:hypothetical protein